MLVHCLEKLIAQNIAQSFFSKKRVDMNNGVGKSVSYFKMGFYLRALRWFREDRSVCST